MRLRQPNKENVLHYNAAQLKEMPSEDLVRAVQTLQGEVKSVQASRTTLQGEVQVTRSRLTEVEKERDALLQEKVQLDVRLKRHGERNGEETDARIKFKDRDISELRSQVDELKKQLKLAKHQEGPAAAAALIGGGEAAVPEEETGSKSAQPLAPPVKSAAPLEVRGPGGMKDSLTQVVPGEILLRVVLADRAVMEALLRVLRTPLALRVLRTPLAATAGPSASRASSLSVASQPAPSLSRSTGKHADQQAAEEDCASDQLGLLTSLFALLAAAPAGSAGAGERQGHGAWVSLLTCLAACLERAGQGVEGIVP